MFASQTTDTVTIQDQAGPVTVTIRKLAGKALRRAATVQLEGTLRRAALASAAVAVSGEQLANALSALEEKKAKTPLTAQQLREQRYTQYDREEVLRAGIQSWTSKETLNDRSRDDLDDDAAEQLHRAILDLSLPPVEVQVVEEQRKND